MIMSIMEVYTPSVRTPVVIITAHCIADEILLEVCEEACGSGKYLISRTVAASTMQIIWERGFHFVH